MVATAPTRDTRPANDDATQQRVRRLVMIVRQACYYVADELGKEYGLDRPCNACRQARRERDKV